ncbi:hypothetical protein [Sinorhizobium fredii]|uniref:hypothetical protein n=1 Tax=Rhizobium fredii TaxID=380 RepID=UPI0035115967
MLADEEEISLRISILNGDRVALCLRQKPRQIRPPIASSDAVVKRILHESAAVNENLKRSFQFSIDSGCGSDV